MKTAFAGKGLLGPQALLGLSSSCAGKRRNSGYAEPAPLASTYTA